MDQTRRTGRDIEVPSASLQPTERRKCMTRLLKMLGAAALIAGVVPYRYTKDEETGEQKIQALLWKAVRVPNGGEKDRTTVNIGFISPFEKEKGEPEIFTQGVVVEYGGGADEDDMDLAEPEAVEQREENTEA